MNSPRNNFAAKFLPFLIAGLTIVLLVIGILVFSWILIIAALVGFVLFIISSISAKFSKHSNTVISRNQPQQFGRTIDGESRTEDEIKKDRDGAV